VNLVLKPIPVGACETGATSVIGWRRASGRCRHEGLFTPTVFMFYGQMLLLLGDEGDNDDDARRVADLSLINFITTS